MLMIIFISMPAFLSQDYGAHLICMTLKMHKNNTEIESLYCLLTIVFHRHMEIKSEM